jgi:hypothetical protein
MCGCGSRRAPTLQGNGLRQRTHTCTHPDSPHLFTGSQMACVSLGGSTVHWRHSLPDRVTGCGPAARPDVHPLQARSAAPCTTALGPGTLPEPWHAAMSHPRHARQRDAPGQRHRRRSTPARCPAKDKLGLSTHTRSSAPCLSAAFSSPPRRSPRDAVTMSQNYRNNPEFSEGYNRQGEGPGAGGGRRARPIARVSRAPACLARQHRGRGAGGAIPDFDRASNHHRRGGRTRRRASPQPPTPPSSPAPPTPPPPAAPPQVTTTSTAAPAPGRAALTTTV